MRSFDVKTWIGGIALFATFLLALPGVKAVRAEDRSDPLASSDGPTCSQQGPEAKLDEASVTMEQLRAQIEAQLGPDADKRIVVLNNRGYNYGLSNSFDRAALGLERLPRGSADRDDRRPRLLGERRPPDGGASEDECARGCVHALAV